MRLISRLRVDLRPSIAALLFAAMLSACASVAEGQAPASRPPLDLALSAEVDELVVNALNDLEVVAGFSFAIYTPDGIYARGFGVTDIETGEPVTADTAFYIASSTKSFTALAFNILDHRGEIDLDMTLDEFAPDALFTLSTQPEKVRLRDLLTHTSGISNAPLGFRAAFTGDHTPELNWRLLAVSTPNEDAPYGVFQYTNEGYNIFTVLTDQKLGVNWRDILAREIFRPVGMTRTTAFMSEAEANNWSIARPHFNGYPDRPVRIRLEKTDSTMQSAGGMVMSANDAVHWLELLIEDGKISGEQIVPADAMQQTRAPLAKVGLEFGAYKRDHYGLGWYVGTYGDDVLVHHFGGFAGFRAHISYMPDRKIGVAGFVNDDNVGFELPDVVANFVYDRLAGKADALAVAKQAIAKLVTDRDVFFGRVAADTEKRAAREWLLSLPRNAYAGSFQNEQFGEIVVTFNNDDMHVVFGNLSAVAEPFTQPETIRVELIPYSAQVLKFILNDNGEVAALQDGRGNRFDRY